MAGFFDPPNPFFGGLGANPFLSGLTTKRRALFSFHFDDVMRVNVVRNAWKVVRPENGTGRTFYDSSLWEARQLENPDTLKRLIREGVECTSAVCVLVGTHTWSRRWVRYEIARAVVDGRGLVAVHINGIRHHRELVAHPSGSNPMAHMAIGKVQQHALATPSYYLFEWTQQGWVRYQDYTQAVKLPPYLQDPAPGYVMPIAGGTTEWDYIGHSGSTNIGAWIDHAARAAGR